MTQHISPYHPIHLLSQGFMSGRIPFAPGTMGTVVGMVIYYVCLSNIPTATYGLWCMLTFVVGCLLCQYTGRCLGEADHKSIVWDEMVGYWLTLWTIPHSTGMMLAAFILFRYFDIRKPWPIRIVDRHCKNGFGVMLDDALAALMAHMCLRCILFFS